MKKIPPTMPLVTEVPARPVPFARSVCACAECVRCCQTVPGYLIPSDLPRLQAALGAATPEELGDQHLLASPGALVVCDGQPFRIPTLVPARHPSGACHWLTAGQRCAVHAGAPFGCAYFTPHEAFAVGHAKSGWGLREVWADWQAAGPYSRLWGRLHAAGRCATDVLAVPKTPADAGRGSDGQNSV